MRARPNSVPWAASVLYEAMPAIEKRLGPGFLPAGEQLYPAGPDEYGEGGFSAVFPCARAGMVCKVTVDGSEAFLVEVLRKMGHLPGLPRYEAEAMKLTRAGEPVWIVWRQDLPAPTVYTDVGRRKQGIRHRYPIDEILFGKDKARRRDMSERCERESAEAGVTDERDLKAAQQAGLSIANLFVSMKDRSIASAQRILRGHMAWAARVFEPTCEDEWSGWRFMKRGESDLNSGERAALNVLAYEMLLGRLAVGRLVPEMAQSLLKLLEQGVLVCDVDPQNVSAARRPYTLFDGGFTFPLDGRWSGLWDSVGPRTERFWNHDARYGAMEVWLG